MQAGHQRSCSSWRARPRWPGRAPSGERPCAAPGRPHQLHAAPAHNAPPHAARRTVASSLVFTPDASRLLVVGGDAVAVLDPATRQELQRVQVPAVMAAALSPKGTYLLTFSRPTKDDSGQGAAAVAVAVATLAPARPAPAVRMAAPTLLAAGALPHVRFRCPTAPLPLLPHHRLQPTRTSRCGAWPTAACSWRCTKRCSPRTPGPLCSSRRVRAPAEGLGRGLCRCRALGRGLLDAPPAPALAWPAPDPPALSRPALPCPALPCPALPCPALPCRRGPCLPPGHQRHQHLLGGRLWGGRGQAPVAQGRRWLCGVPRGTAAPAGRSLRA